MYGVLESCLFALVCIQIELQRNFKPFCLYFFFLKFELPNRGCGLSTGAAYTRNFTVTSNNPHLNTVGHLLSLIYTILQCIHLVNCNLSISVGVSYVGTKVIRTVKVCLFPFPSAAA